MDRPRTPPYPGDGARSLTTHRSSVGDLILDLAAVSRAPHFDPDFRSRLHELFVWRRDVRRFRPDPIPDEQLDSFLAAACLAPSVGLSQPWRFVVVDSPARRRAIVDNF